jgi:hypothetical protein
MPLFQVLLRIEDLVNILKRDEPPDVRSDNQDPGENGDDDKIEEV